jgi:hypothetical protein
MRNQTKRPGAGIFVAIPGKALFALEIEINLGLKVYPATNHDVTVWREGQQYWLQRLDPRNDGTELEKGEFPAERTQYVHVLPADRPSSGQVIQTITMQYDSFADLLEDWPRLSVLAVWSTQQTAERLAWRPKRCTL